MEGLSASIADHRSFLFFGRGINYPIALEGALKLKEISYLHAQGFPAGEMKHGPIALIDEEMVVVALAPGDALFEKSLGNIQEAKARGGRVVVVTTESRAAVFDDILDSRRDAVLRLPDAHPLMMPVLLSIPMQLLAYFVAFRRGCDVDQPRNLAKSVTVE
jgi:glucosamine--fructose-6-phosphate aminotransferase (isomerizing)